MQVHDVVKLEECNDISFGKHKGLEVCISVQQLRGSKYI